MKIFLNEFGGVENADLSDRVRITDEGWQLDGDRAEPIGEYIKTEDGLTLVFEVETLNDSKINHCLKRHIQENQLELDEVIDSWYPFVIRPPVLLGMYVEVICLFTPDI